MKTTTTTALAVALLAVGCSTRGIGDDSTPTTTPAATSDCPFSVRADGTVHFCANPEIPAFTIDADVIAVGLSWAEAKAACSASGRFLPDEHQWSVVEFYKAPVKRVGPEWYFDPALETPTTVSMAWTFIADAPASNDDIGYRCAVEDGR